MISRYMILLKVLQFCEATAFLLHATSKMEKSAAVRATIVATASVYSYLHTGVGRDIHGNIVAKTHIFQETK